MSDASPVRHRLDRGSGLVVLFFAQLFLLGGQPFFVIEGHPSMLPELSVALIPLVGTYAMRGGAWQFRGALALLVPTLALWVAGHIAGIEELRVWELASALTLLTFVAGCLLHCILEVRRVTRTMLVGAAALYLLLGFLWTHAYALVVELDPSALSAAGNVTDWNELTYFSFSTITTLGLGDITPVSPIARSLTSLEAVLGVLYVGVIVARFAGAYRATEGEGTH